MTEINNNFSHIVSNISANTNNKKAEVQPQQTEYQNTMELSSEMGVLGKSQVARPDNIQSDIDFCMKQSPEFLNKCDMFFEQSFNMLSESGDEFAYENACVFSKEFANEFAENKV